MKKLLMVWVAMLLAACGSETSGHSASAPVQAASSSSVMDTAKTAFLQSFREGFVKEGIASCIKSANVGEKARKPCECAINKLNESFSNDELLAMSKGKAPADLNQRMEKMTQACMETLKK